ncbi:MAG: hypothetical protein D5R96_01820 [Methanocalculus sp. MSAO_Arc2]|nr:MAG: hypothetical protein D5R96_01820 [Methanocalculus sp. MSAO_Arc2]
MKSRGDKLTLQYRGSIFPAIITPPEIREKEICRSFHAIIETIPADYQTACHQSRRQIFHMDLGKSYEGTCYSVLKIPLQTT